MYLFLLSFFRRFLIIVHASAVFFFVLFASFSSFSSFFFVAFYQRNRKCRSLSVMIQGFGNIRCIYAFICVIYFSLGIFLYFYILPLVSLSLCISMKIFYILFIYSSHSLAAFAIHITLNN